jgi:hypothetical protein
VRATVISFLETSRRRRLEGFQGGAEKLFDSAKIAAREPRKTLMQLGFPALLIQHPLHLILEAQPDFLEGDFKNQVFGTEVGLVVKRLQL